MQRYENNGPSLCGGMIMLCIGASTWAFSDIVEVGHRVTPGRGDRAIPSSWNALREVSGMFP